MPTQGIIAIGEKLYVIGGSGAGNANRVFRMPE